MQESGPFAWKGSAVAKENLVSPHSEAADVTTEEILATLSSLDGKLTELLGPFVREVEAVLARLAGRSFGRRGNEAIVRTLQLLLQRLGLRVRCTHCRAPAILRCRATGNAKGGSFQFEHYLNGKQTNHGGRATFPKVRLVPAPSDRRRKRRKRN